MSSFTSSNNDELLLGGLRPRTASPPPKPMKRRRLRRLADSKSAAVSSSSSSLVFSPSALASSSPTSSLSQTKTEKWRKTRRSLQNESDSDFVADNNFGSHSSSSTNSAQSLEHKVESSNSGSDETVCFVIGSSNRATKRKSPAKSSNPSKVSPKRAGPKNSSHASESSSEDERDEGLSYEDKLRLARERGLVSESERDMSDESDEDDDLLDFIEDDMPSHRRRRSDFDKDAPNRQPRRPARPPTPLPRVFEELLAKRSPCSKFKAMRKQIANRLFERFDSHIFGDQLAPSVHLRWSSKMRTTAGQCIPNVHSSKRRVTLELSERVLDVMWKLRQTLCHEMCHAAVWIIDRDDVQGHGAAWRRWVIRSEARFKNLDITTQHSYEVNFKFKWICKNTQCRQIVGRHSNSVSVNEDRCMPCDSRFASLGEFGFSGNPVFSSRRPLPNSLTTFVRVNFTRYRRENVDISHDDVLRLIADDFELQSRRARSK